MKQNTLAQNLVFQRKRKGLTQEKLSEKTQVTIRTIQRIEKGEVNPHLNTIKLLAVALEIDVNDLLVIENPKEESIQKKWLLILHGAPLVGIMFPVFNILIALFLWIHKREDNIIYDRQGRAIVNFHITMSILMVLSFVSLLTVEGYGFFIFISMVPLTVLIVLVNILSVINSGKFYYPFSIPFLNKKKIRSVNVVLLISFLSSFFLGGCNENRDDISRLNKSIITKNKLTTEINRLVSNAQVHGLAVAVFEKNQVSYQKTFGFKNVKLQKPFSNSTNWYGASLSKAVFAVLVMKLVEESVIDLDRPLESYLSKKIYEYVPKTKWHDDYSSLKNDTLYSKITARMCLNHTSGFPNWRWFEPDKRLRVKFQPGSKYSYSGEGFVYLQVVIEKITGQSIEQLAQQKIFVPLKMKNSSYQWQGNFENDYASGHSVNGKVYKKDKDNEPRGGSTLETTFEDYILFMEAVLQNQILSKSSWNAVFKPQIRIKSEKQFGSLATSQTDRYDDINLSYGLGWGIISTPYGFGAFKEGHGDGFEHYSIVFPDSGKGVLIMSNSENGESIFKELLELTMADTFTPWEWENYIPFDQI